MGQSTFHGRPGRGMRGRPESVNLVITVVADSRIEHWGSRRIEAGNWNISRWVHKFEIGGIKEGSGARSTGGTEDATAFTTVLLGVSTRLKVNRRCQDVRVGARTSQS